MKEFPDNHFCLSVIDPPYGININHSIGRRKGEKSSDYKKVDWDNKPPKKLFFEELFRVSKDQIIWGANHFISLIPYDSSCWLLFDKKVSEDVSFAQYEMAWTSLKGTCKKFDFRWSGMLQEDMKNKEIRIHPTQKPVALYDWIFKNYATEGMKILDTHLGSQSSRISAYKYKMDFTGYELDPDYFEQGCKRFEDFKSQLTLF
jgi:site-specific DNA-methyltransferase (adenine-specific)